MSADSSRAVFLSYASQDADAARRLCEALRAAGVEVWFDQSELVGGDAWDQKIRKQIKECALFAPIISANTQSRREGYFRIEWKLAAQRTHAIADGTPFLLPIVIDDTRDADALVPEEFRAVQWTRLPDGETNAAFCARVKKLLGGEFVAGRGLRTPPASDERPKPAGFGDPARQRKVGRRVPPAAWIGATVVALTAIVWLSQRRNETSPSPNAGAGTRPSAAEKSAAPIEEPKTLAVLAFENLSGDKDNEYFSDGISEELLTMLQKIPGLKVAARQSAFSFKGKNASAQEIGEKLGVAHLVEGSVRKSGSSVRIAARMSRAATGEQLWAENYSRELKDIFAVQDEIAGIIAKQLQLSLGAAPRAAQTVNPEAHRLVLEGRHFWNLRTNDGFARAEAAFQQSVAIDSQWAPAHAALADLWAIRAAFEGDSDDVFRRYCEQARVAARRALQLDPELAHPHSALGCVAMLAREWSDSERQFAKALELAPGDATVHDWHGDLFRATGRLDSALREYQSAGELDPLSPFVLFDICYTLKYAGRFSESLAFVERGLALSPGRIRLEVLRAELLVALNRTTEAQSVLRATVAGLLNHDDSIWASDAVFCFRQLGLEGEATHLASELLKRMSPSDLSRGDILMALGRWDEACAAFEAAPPRLSDGIAWHPMCDPVRDEPRFQQMIVKIGLAEEYKVARATLARMQAEPRK